MQIRPFLRFMSEIADKIPSPHDRPLTALAKLVSIFDKGLESWSRTRMRHGALVGDGFDERTSRPFVGLFFETALSKRFALHRHFADEHTDLIEARDGRGGRLVFEESRWGSHAEISDRFFHSPGFDFAGAMDAIWREEFADGLYVTAKETVRGMGSRIVFAPVARPREIARSSAARNRCAEIVVCRRAMGLDEPCGYIFHGPPGTGKTAMAHDFAVAMRGRLLLIDASALPLLGLDDITLLLEALEPTFVLIEDFDRAPVSEAGARVLFLFDQLSARREALTVILTCNHPAVIDPAVLRSERIGTAESFALPEPEERLEILRAAAAHYEMILPVVDMVDATDGFNHVDLIGLVRRLKRYPLDAALKHMNALRALAAEAERRTQNAAPAALSS